MNANATESRLPHSLHRATLAAALVERLSAEEDRLRSSWLCATPFAHIVIDDLFSAEVANDLHARLPRPELLVTRSSHRQRKRVGVDLDLYDPAISELLFAFQQDQVVRHVENITGLAALTPDPSLYASGLSVMSSGGFLNPHLDNSHDGDQNKYRAINLLYYLSPGWTLTYGGNLELWDERLRHATTVLSAFNRLVVMKTDRSSWHSVERVVSRRPRWCASNYYFSPRSPGDATYRHVTTFAGRPEEKVKRLLLAVDGLAANAVGKLFPAVLRRNKHRRANESARASSETIRESGERSPDDTSAPNDAEPGR